MELASLVSFSVMSAYTSVFILVYCDDGRIRERLEPSHRCATPLDRAAVLLDQIVEVLVRAHLDVPPARVFTSQQPQCAPTRHMTVESHFAWDAWSVRRECLAKERLRSVNSAVAAKHGFDFQPLSLRDAECSFQISRCLFRCGCAVRIVQRGLEALDLSIDDLRTGGGPVDAEDQVGPLTSSERSQPRRYLGLPGIFLSFCEFCLVEGARVAKTAPPVRQ